MVCELVCGFVGEQVCKTAYVCESMCVTVDVKRRSCMICWRVCDIMCVYMPAWERDCACMKSPPGDIQR